MTTREPPRERCATYERMLNARRSSTRSSRAAETADCNFTHDFHTASPTSFQTNDFNFARLRERIREKP